MASLLEKIPYPSSIEVLELLAARREMFCLCRKFFCLCRKLVLVILFSKGILKLSSILFKKMICLVLLWVI